MREGFLDSDGDDRGVSEVVGFVLIFSLVLMTISIVYAGGISGLQDARDAEQINNAERAFDVLATNFAQMARNDAPTRATEIKLANAQLSVGSHERSNVSIANQTMSNAGGSPLIHSRPITYTSGGGTSIVYEYGAVIREQEDGAIMLQDPDFVFGENRTVIRYTTVRGGSQEVAGSTTVLVRGQLRSSQLEFSSSEHQNVTYQMVTSDGRANVWVSYFEDELVGLNGDCDRSATGEDTTVVECTFETEVVYVAKSEITVKLSA